jgi:hypothetical protein
VYSLRPDRRSSGAEAAKVPSACCCSGRRTLAAMRAASPLAVSTVLSLAMALAAASAAAAATAVVAAPPPPPPPSSTVGHAAAAVLQGQNVAEAAAVRDAVAADLPSRAGDGDGEEGQVRSWSQLYQWAMKASASAAAASVGEDGSGAGALPAEGGGHVVRKVLADGDSGSGEADHGAAAAAAPAAAAAAHAEVLQRLGQELPEFQGEIVVLEAAVAALKSAESPPGVVENALETVAELCHSGDNGVDLHTVGGLAAVVAALADPAAPAAVHQAAARALATCAQNNPPVDRGRARRARCG